MNKDKLKKEYQEGFWDGFEAGKQSSLKHNINLMKLQLKASKELKEKNVTKYKK